MIFNFSGAKRLERLEDQSNKTKVSKLYSYSKFKLSKMGQLASESLHLTMPQIIMLGGSLVSLILFLQTLLASGANQNSPIKISDTILMCSTTENVFIVRFRS